MSPRLAPRHSGGHHARTSHHPIGRPRPRHLHLARRHPCPAAALGSVRREPHRSHRAQRLGQIDPALAHRRGAHPGIRHPRGRGRRRPAAAAPHPADRSPRRRRARRRRLPRRRTRHHRRRRRRPALRHDRRRLGRRGARDRRTRRGGPSRRRPRPPHRRAVGRRSGARRATTSSTRIRPTGRRSRLPRARRNCARPHATCSARSSGS